jgi:hypothetical protein
MINRCGYFYDLSGVVLQEEHDIGGGGTSTGYLNLIAYG